MQNEPKEPEFFSDSAKFEKYWNEEIPLEEIAEDVGLKDHIEDIAEMVHETELQAGGIQRENHISQWHGYERMFVMGYLRAIEKAKIEEYTHEVTKAREKQN